MCAKQINVVDEAIVVLTSLKTQELVKAIDAQQNAIQDLKDSLQKYVDWLEEQIVRIDGEK